jgi:hypothetical protein
MHFIRVRLTRCVDSLGETRGWLREQIYFDHFKFLYSTIIIALLEASKDNELKPLALQDPTTNCGFEMIVTRREFLHEKCG